MWQDGPHDRRRRRRPPGPTADAPVMSVGARRPAQGRGGHRGWNGRRCRTGQRVSARPRRRPPRRTRSVPRADRSGSAGPDGVPADPDRGQARRRTQPAWRHHQGLDARQVPKVRQYPGNQAAKKKSISSLTKRRGRVESQCQVWGTMGVRYRAKCMPSRLLRVQREGGTPRRDDGDRPSRRRQSGDEHPLCGMLAHS
jgi:hypothetical protein